MATKAKTLVDTNILLDVFSRDPTWWRWSITRLEEAAQEGPLLINDIIYAESSIRFPDAAGFDALLEDMGVTVAPFSRLVPFVAGRPSLSTGKPADRETGCYRISSSARMPRSNDCRC